MSEYLQSFTCSFLHIRGQAKTKIQTLKIETYELFEQKPTANSHGLWVTSFLEPWTELSIIYDHTEAVRLAKTQHERILATHAFLAFRMADHICVENLQDLCYYLAVSAVPHLAPAVIKSIMKDKMPAPGRMYTTPGAKNWQSGWSW